jgi:hypothetical protein
MRLIWHTRSTFGHGDGYALRNNGQAGARSLSLDENSSQRNDPAIHKLGVRRVARRLEFPIEMRLVLAYLLIAALSAGAVGLVWWLRYSSLDARDKRRMARDRARRGGP